MLQKKFKIVLAAFALIGFQSQAQLTIQSGATFSMQAGAQVTVQGNVDNAGSLTNNGALRVQGNYTNTSAYTGTGSLEIYGTGNSDLSAGASPIANLIINKTVATDVVKLTATAVVNTTLTHTNGVFTTDPANPGSFTVTSPLAAVYTFAAGKEIVGSVKRTGWNLGPAGTAYVFNTTNMLVATNGGTAPSDLTVTMIPQSAGGDPTQNEREAKRKYTFTKTGGTGFTADVRFPYLASELNTNQEANLVPWRLLGTEWNADTTNITRNAGADWVNAPGILAADLIQEWKLADPDYTMNVTANLRGPWNGVSAMNTSLLAGGIIPLGQPYNTTPFNYTGSETVSPNPIPANVVDWVLIEHRKPAIGLPENALIATISGREAGFLLSNGTVVGLDGVTPINVTITKQGPAFIVIRHRNHLGVMSNLINSNATGTFANDYTVLANSYKPVGAPSDPVVLLAGAGGKYGLWLGDGNKNGIVNATDVTVIKSAIAASATGYQFTDVNLSNTINATDVTLTKTTISLSGTGSGTTALTSNNKNKTVKTNIPDPIIED